MQRMITRCLGTGWYNTRTTVFPLDQLLQPSPFRVLTGYDESHGGLRISWFALTSFYFIQVWNPIRQVVPNGDLFDPRLIGWCWWQDSKREQRFFAPESSGSRCNSYNHLPAERQTVHSFNVFLLCIKTDVDIFWWWAEPIVVGEYPHEITYNPFFMRWKKSAGCTCSILPTFC